LIRPWWTKLPFLRLQPEVSPITSKLVAL
jgi:hypothetical protein